MEHPGGLYVYVQYMCENMVFMHYDKYCGGIGVSAIACQSEGPSLSFVLGGFFWPTGTGVNQASRNEYQGFPRKMNAMRTDTGIFTSNTVWPRNMQALTLHPAMACICYRI